MSNVNSFVIRNVKISTHDDSQNSLFKYSVSNFPFPRRCIFNFNDIEPLEKVKALKDMQLFFRICFDTQIIFKSTKVYEANRNDAETNQVKINSIRELP